MFQQRKLSFRSPSFSRKRKPSFKINRVKNSTKVDTSSCNNARTAKEAAVRGEAFEVLQEILENQQVHSVKTYTLHGVKVKVHVLEDTTL